jgi:hypothetical protein
MGDAANRRYNRTRFTVILIVPLHNRTLNSPTSGALHTLQQKETRKHQSTNETKTTHNTNPATTKSAWCCSSERQPTPSFPLSQLHCLQTHPSEERSKNTNSANSSNGDAANTQSQQSPQSHSIQGGIARGSLSTIHFEQSNQWSVTHTSSKETQKYQSPTKPRLLTLQFQRQ